MNAQGISYKDTKNFALDMVDALYRANRWSAADKPEKLRQGLLHSDTVVSAWDGDLLVGLGNAISDGHLVVYYPHLLVLPQYQRRGIGQRIFNILSTHYRGFHQQVVLADVAAVGFYEACGLRKANGTMAMWVFQGSEHGAAR